MSFAGLKRLLASLSLVVLTPLAIPAAQAQEPFTDETPQRWFVELSTPPKADGGAPGAIAAEQASFRSQANAAGIKYSVRYAYSGVFNGFSVQVPRRDVAKLTLIPGVKTLYPVREVPLPQATPGATPDQQDWLSMTGADVAQNELGLKGDGVVVAIMDTGIDYNHPDLGGCFGAGCRVEKGFDLVGDAFNNGTVPDPTPDNDPMDCAGHGTHVAGIVGANGHGLAGHVTGVAPNVKFHAYRVFGCEGTTSDDIMLAAMDMILADGADVLNMSIGSAFDNWSESPTAAGSDRLARRGIVVVASAGNSGTSGLNTTGSPSTGTRVISVASFENLTVKLPAFTVSPDNAPFGYNAAVAAPPPPTSGTFPMARTGTTTTANDACAPLAGDFSGKVVLIRRGTCSFNQKAFNAQQAGAAGVVLYNNAVGFITPTVIGPPTITIPVVAITAADGATIDARIAAGPTTMTWTDQLTSTPNPTAGLVSTFSSYGLTAELDLKPDLGAPGGNIFSTYPLALGGYATLSGTSMASPHVAGSAALLLQSRPHAPVTMVRDLLQNNGVPANWNGNPGLGFLDNVHVQGAGLIHIDRTVLNPGSVTPAKLALGDSASGPATRTLTFSNRGTTAITYALSHTAALSTGPNEFTIGESTAKATVAFSAPTVTVPAGGSATVDVTITAPANTLFTYGGYLVATPQGGGLTMRVPYAGVVNYQAVNVLGHPVSNLPRLTHGGLTAVTDGAVFNLAANDLPTVAFQIAHSARNVTAVVYSAPSSPGGPLGRNWHKAFSFDYVPRNTTAGGVYLVPFDGTTSNGRLLTTLPAGSYVIVMTALQPLGDPSNPASVETWQSPVFSITR